MGRRYGAKVWGDKKGDERAKKYTDKHQTL